MLCPLCNLETKSCKQLSSFFTDEGGGQYVAGWGSRLFGLRFEVRFTVLVPFKCGLMCVCGFLAFAGHGFP